MSRSRPNPDPGALWRELSRRELLRREVLRGAGLGLGSLALGSLLEGDLAAQERRLPDPHHAPRARNVIYLFMAGGPSQLDLFERKPELDALHGKTVPPSFMQGERFAFIGPQAKLLASQRRFERHGECGAWVSELLPHLGGVVDELCFLKGMHTSQINHGPAKLLVNTGTPDFGRPSMGAWVTYGIGSENADLPAFCVLLSGSRGPRVGQPLWGAGFLPSHYQGVPLRSEGDPILHLRAPDGFTHDQQGRFLAAVRELDEARHAAVGDDEIRSRIEAYEMAFRMQSSAPELIDLADEPREVLELYGVEPGEASYARNCLLARRLVERGVRFVQLYHTDWDHHGTNDLNLGPPLEKVCREIDRASAALILDLKRRGLLEDTLVVWGGEFGRTPMSEIRQRVGRDHHIEAYTMWLAGGGVRAGTTVGATDEIGFSVVEDPIHVHDLQATILHLLGLDHERLTYRSQGRDFRLTDVEGKVVEKVLA